MGTEVLITPSLSVCVSTMLSLFSLALVLLLCVLGKKRRTEGTYRPSAEERKQVGTAGSEKPGLPLPLPKEERLIWHLHRGIASLHCYSINARLDDPYFWSYATVFPFAPVSLRARHSNTLSQFVPHHVFKSVEGLHTPNPRPKLVAHIWVSIWKVHLVSFCHVKELSWHMYCICTFLLCIFIYITCIMMFPLMKNIDLKTMKMTVMHF